MDAAEQWEPDDARVSRPVLRERGAAIAPRHSPRAQDLRHEALVVGSGGPERHGARCPNAAPSRQARGQALQLRIPKLRQGSYFPPFLEARKSSEKALIAVIQEAWIGGVSTRRVDDLVQAMGLSGISKSVKIAKAIGISQATPLLSKQETPLQQLRPRGRRRRARPRGISAMTCRRARLVNVDAYGDAANWVSFQITNATGLRTLRRGSPDQ